MSSWNLTNTTNTPINVRISNAGLTCDFINDLAPGQTHSFTKQAAVWYDITGYYASQATRINPSAGNPGQAGTIVTTVLGILGTATGVAMMFVPDAQGAALALIPAALSGTISVLGATMSFGSVALLVAQDSYFPVTIGNVYGGDDYALSITGGLDISVDPLSSAAFRVTNARPIGVDWTNNSSKRSGTVTGKVIRAAQGRSTSKMPSFVAASLAASAPEGYPEFIRVQLGTPQSYLGSSEPGRVFQGETSFTP